MRKSNLEKLREAKQKNFKPVELDGLAGALKLLLGGQPNPTQEAFVYAQDEVRGYMGPAGCAKTSTLIATGMMRSLFMPGSRGVVARWDYNKLMGTTMADMERVLARLPKGILLDRDKSPPAKWILRPFIEGDPCEISFISLKDNLGGYAWDWAVVDEADDVPESEPVRQLLSRLRAPNVDKYGSRMLGLAFNPPRKSHWLYTACTGKDAQDRPVDKPWITMFKPQPKENVHNLPKGYYEMMAASLTDDQRRRLVDGEWGSTFEGQPVYREFSHRLHVRDAIPQVPYAPVFRFWDFGYNHPACVWAQLDAEGRLLILRAEMGNQIEIVPWALYCKGITETFFGGAECVDYGDPAVRQHKDTGSTLAELLKVGVTMHYRISKIEEGLRVVRLALERIIRGEPAVQFDRRYCGLLIDAIAGGYRLDNSGDKPWKDGYYEHVADAFRYGLLNLFGNAGFNYRPASSMTELPSSLAYDSRYDVYSRN